MQTSTPEKTEAEPQTLFGLVTVVLNSLGTGWIFFLMVIINADIIGRAVFNRPIQGVAEIVAMSIVGIVLLQLPHTLRSGRFLRSDLFLGTLQERWPRAYWLIEALYNCIGAVLMGFILSYSWHHFVEAWEIGLYIGTFGQFMFPLWPVRLLILIGVTLTGIQFVLLMYRALRQSWAAPQGDAL